jgi:hypothetical protein
VQTNEGKRYSATVLATRFLRELGEALRAAARQQDKLELRRR